MGCSSALFANLRFILYSDQLSIGGFNFRAVGNMWHHFAFNRAIIAADEAIQVVDILITVKTDVNILRECVKSLIRHIYAR